MVAKLDALGIVTSDMARSLAFYRLLGVETPQELDDHVEAVLPNGLRLMWDSIDLVRQINPNWQTPIGHRMGLAFLADSPAGVDAIYRKIVGSGYDGVKEPWDAFWGQRYAQVADPDGNIIDLFAPLESRGEPG